MTVETALEMLQNMGRDDSDAGALSESEESDSDRSWVKDRSNTSSSSERESAGQQRKKRRRLSSKNSDRNIAFRLDGPFDGVEPAAADVCAGGGCGNGQDGTAWTVLPLSDRPGRTQSQNVLTEAAGPTAHAQRNVEDALTAFVCLLDDGMLKHIRDCTVAEAHRHLGDSSWDLTVAELKAFTALLYVRGAQGAKHINDDEFALVSATWNKFVANSIACYKPGADITIDEQLFPTKARCKFIQYMGNKPDKFGIKFWLAADVQSKYMLNGAPYLGKEESKGQLLGESVVLKLAEPFLGKGRNITTDHFFTSLKLATALQAKKTSLVGPLGEAKRECPPSVKEPAELFSTKVLKCANATLTIYQGKPRQNVCILSSVHTSVGITDGPKAKPESVTYYNNTKHAVDVLDQMAKAYSVKDGTRRWPVAVFYNILNLAGINAHVLYKECTSSRIPRRRFLLQLAEELRAEFMEGKRAAAHGAGPQQQPPPHLAQQRRQCQVRRSCNPNKTQDTCTTCRKPVCGNCVKRRAVTCVDCV
ncbi:uncharacterized protein LOC116678920 [Etheostoma spectabile]|uniref:uncharacterized protein LOC116678920 n=1 Tax=Etheostoma spectabile TaxID=54343 RepID=UPI0013AFBA53|nr:uncharacterized protein LOC116678920 [Etheostoma spectabile]